MKRSAQRVLEAAYLVVILAAAWCIGYAASRDRTPPPAPPPPPAAPPIALPTNPFPRGPEWPHAVPTRKNPWFGDLSAIAPRPASGRSTELAARISVNLAQGDAK